MPNTFARQSPFSSRSARVRLIVPLAAAAMLLAGCSQLESLLNPSGDPMAPEGGELVMTLTGSGAQQFQCVSDKQGRWWKFIAPDVKLTDSAGRVVAHQRPDFIFQASDGSIASARITGWDKKPKSQADLRDVVFTTRAQGKITGLLTPIRWVTRTEGKGGQPLTRCSASQLGSTLKIPFTATYRLYR